MYYIKKLLYRGNKARRRSRLKRRKTAAKTGLFFQFSPNIPSSASAQSFQPRLMALESDLQLQALLLNYNNSNKNNDGMGGDSFQQQHMQPACDMDPTILEFYPDHHFRHLTELAQKKGDYLQLNAKVTFEKMELL